LKQLVNAAASRVTTLLATWLLTTNGLLAAPGIAIAADIQQPLQSGRFSTLYEPSGVVVLNASLAIVIEDEMAKPLRQLHLTSDNASSELSIQERSMASAGSFWKRQKLGPLDDLEGIAHLSETQFIVVGSHDDATRKSHSLRQKLVLFTLENQQVDDVRLNRDLYTHIINAYPELAKKLRKSGKSDGHELNIEALAYDRKRDYLLIGLRSPTLDSNAVIVTIRQRRYSCFELRRQKRYISDNKPARVWQQTAF